jgi:hypothetical protein
MDDLKKSEDAPDTGERSITGGDTRLTDGEEFSIVEEEITVKTFTGGDTR